MTQRKMRPRKETDAARHYDTRGVLSEIVDAPVEFALDEALRESILAGKRARRLQNVTIKLDPAHVHALRKIATKRSIPYQTLIRQWLAAGIRSELKLVG